MKGEEMLKLLGYLDEDLIMESAGFGETGRKTLRRMNPKKLVVVLLAATLVLALGVMAVSAGVRHARDRAILDFMGIRDADTTQLEDGTVLIGESDICSGRDLLTGEQKEITFTASSSIGDKNVLIYGSIRTTKSRKILTRKQIILWRRILIWKSQQIISRELWTAVLFCSPRWRMGNCFFCWKFQVRRISTEVKWPLLSRISIIIMIWVWETKTMHPQKSWCSVAVGTWSGNLIIGQ